MAVTVTYHSNRRSPLKLRLSCFCLSGRPGRAPAAARRPEFRVDMMKPIFLVLIVLLLSDSNNGIVGCIGFRLLMINRPTRPARLTIDVERTVQPCMVDRRSLSTILAGSLLFCNSKICQSTELSPPIPSAEQIEKARRKKAIEVVYYSCTGRVTFVGLS